MTTTIYVQADQVARLWEQGSPMKESVPGVAFEWPGESIIHLYTTPPSVGHGGARIGGHFLILDNESEVEESEEILRERVAAAIAGGNVSEMRGVIACVALDRERVVKRAFLLDHDELTECEVRYIPGRSELYSRSRGLLEVDVLADKTVTIIGLGSFGGPIAVELAKTGIGAFHLMDFDRLELANISRHCAGLHDLGRFKTQAVRDAILLKNPYARVHPHEVDVNEKRDLLLECINQSDLVICVTDENRSRFNVNSLVVDARKPAVFGRAITRAAGGDVFRYRPHAGPCLACLFGQGLFQSNEEVSSFHQARRDAPAYVGDDDLDAVVQVGLATDIAPITNLVEKLCLVELSRGSDAGIQSLEEDLIAPFYIWANRRDLIYDQWPKMEYFFNKNTILRWYGVKAERDPGCLVCGAPES